MFKHTQREGCFTLCSPCYMQIARAGNTIWYSEGSLWVVTPDAGGQEVQVSLPVHAVWRDGDNKHQVVFVANTGAFEPFSLHAFNS